MFNNSISTTETFNKKVFNAVHSRQCKRYVRVLINTKRLNFFSIAASKSWGKLDKGGDEPKIEIL